MKVKTKLFDDEQRIIQTQDLQAVRERAERNTLAFLAQPEPQYQRRGDGLDWARRVLARVEAGDHVEMYAEKLAREALAEPVQNRQPGEDDE